MSKICLSMRVRGNRHIFFLGTVSAWMCHLKGHCVVFGEEIQTQDFNSHDMNEVIIQTEKYLVFA